MTDERWPRVKALFQAAVERPPEEREAFLAAATADDEALRHEVESLLTSDASDVSFLDRLPGASEPVLADLLATPLASMDHAASRSPHPWSSNWSGRNRRPAWRGRHGRGVPRARHEAQSRRRPQVPAGAFTSDPDRLARFKREAQMLATLNHPNIAAIYGFEELERPHGAGARARRRADARRPNRARAAVRWTTR